MYRSDWDNDTRTVNLIPNAVEVNGIKAYCYNTGYRESSPHLVKIASEVELAAYLQIFGDFPSNMMSRFFSENSGYDASFFSESFLAFVAVMDNSGSNTYRIDSVNVDYARGLYSG